MGGWGGVKAAVAAVVVACVFFSGSARADQVDDIGDRVVKRAVRLVGLAKLSAVTSKVPDDCSGVVRFPYMREGVNLLEGQYPPDMNAVTAIYLRAKALNALTSDLPKPGDLAFFKETYDRNRDGKRNDGLTHVAVVERVDEDGTVTLIHHGRKGVARTHMNLALADVHRDATKRLLNDILVPAKKGTKQYLTSELFVSFAKADALKNPLPAAVAARAKSSVNKRPKTKVTQKS